MRHQVRICICNTHNHERVAKKTLVSTHDSAGPFGTQAAHSACIPCSHIYSGYWACIGNRLAGGQHQQLCAFCTSHRARITKTRFIRPLVCIMLGLHDCENAARLCDTAARSRGHTTIPLWLAGSSPQLGSAYYATHGRHPG